MKLRRFSITSIILALLALCELSHAHYSPELGNFLSRDPIEEDGGVNLYAFAERDPVNKYDKLGLKIVINPIMEVTLEGGRALRNGPRLYGGWYGNTRGVKDAAKARKGKNKVVTYGPNDCCVKIEKSMHYEIEVSTTIASDLLNSVYTEEGYTAITAHEQRRRDVYQTGHDVFLEVFDDDIESKCGACFETPKKATDYSKALATWLNEQHRRATKEYNAFVISNQKSIGDENRRTNWITEEGLFHGFKSTHPPKIPEFDLEPCPK